MESCRFAGLSHSPLRDQTVNRGNVLNHVLDEHITQQTQPDLDTCCAHMTGRGIGELKRRNVAVHRHIVCRRLHPIADRRCDIRGVFDVHCCTGNQQLPFQCIISIPSDIMTASSERTRHPPAQCFAEPQVQFTYHNQT